MNTKIAQIFASVFYVGWLPVAPGTWASLLALIIWFLIIPNVSITIFLILIAILFAFGVYISNIIESDINQKDPSFIVIDEWVGQWIALLFLPYSFVWGIIAFGLFRIFDIWKPYPVGKFDKLNGGWGIMLDDVMAGTYSLVIIQLIRLLIK
jgi:phosphatidylglycerophosphatase A